MEQEPTPLTERPNPDSADLDRLGTLDLVRLFNAQDALVAAAVAREAPAIARAVDGIVGRLERGGRLRYFGAGTSGRLGVLDASECPPTFSTPPELVQGHIAGGDYALRHAVEGAEDDAEAGAEAARQAGVGPDDAVIGIAASGATPYTIGAVRAAREAGALTVAVACNAGSPLAAAAEIAVEPVVGPEVISGSTRLKAGTAQKLVLNTISTAVMVRLGKTYGNLMVDLRASNEKLRRRAVRLVGAATGADAERSAAALAASGGEVKTAIVALRLGLEPAAARSRLDAAGGHVRRALGE